MPSNAEKMQMYVPPGPSKFFILYTYMVYLHNMCKWEAGPSGGIYFDIKNGDYPINLRFVVV